MANKKRSELEMLEKYRVALENVQNQTEIASTMTEFGYDETTVAEGVAIFNNTRQAFDFNKTEDDETNATYVDFTFKKEQVAATYMMHRKKAKVVFRKDKVTADRLGVTGTLPQAYIKWLDTVKKFYSVATTDTDVQSKLVKLKITAEDLTASDTAVKALEAARADYLREKGESQDATKAKDQAFAVLDDWMLEFYDVARIALEDKPQLLEALGLLVKS